MIKNLTNGQRRQVSCPSNLLFPVFIIKVVYSHCAWPRHCIRIRLWDQAVILSVRVWHSKDDQPNVSMTTGLQNSEQKRTSYRYEKPQLRFWPGQVEKV